MVIFLPDIPPGNFWSHMFMDKVKAISKGELVIKLIGGPEAIPAPDAPAAAQRGSVDITNSMFPFADTLTPGMDTLGRAEYAPAELRKNVNLPLEEHQLFVILTCLNKNDIGFDVLP